MTQKPEVVFRPLFVTYSWLILELFWSYSPTLMTGPAHIREFWFGWRKMSWYSGIFTSVFLYWFLKFNKSLLGGKIASTICDSSWYFLGEWQQAHVTWPHCCSSQINAVLAWTLLKWGAPNFKANLRVTSKVLGIKFVKMYHFWGYIYFKKLEINLRTAKTARISEGVGNSEYSQ